MLWRYLADATAVLHVLVVVYVVAGLPLVAVGLWRGWRWVRGFGFRFTHLLLCLIVIAFEWLNAPCPLTTLERALRAQAADGSGYEGGFIQHYLSEAIHLHVEPRALAVPTSIWVLAVFALYVWAGPHRKPEQVSSKQDARDEGAFKG